jgi:hypothetical protein
MVSKTGVLLSPSSGDRMTLTTDAMLYTKFSTTIVCVKTPPRGRLDPRKCCTICQKCSERQNIFCLINRKIDFHIEDSSEEIESL